MKNKKRNLVMILAIVGIVLATIGVTYAWFSYSKNGVEENVITSGTIKFHYQEGNRTVSIDDMMPMTDGQGKAQTDYFDFTITSSTSATIDIPYYITAKMTNSSNQEMAEIVKVYLTKVDNSGNETEVLLTHANSLGTYTHNSINIPVTEGLLYSSRVYAGDSNYEQKYRLRMWIDYDTEFLVQEEGQLDVYPYEGMQYALTVNVYSNGEVMTSAQEEIRQNVNVEDIEIGSNVVTSDTTTLEETEYLTPGQETMNKTITVNTSNPDAIVTVENLTPTSMNTNVKRLSSNHTITLRPGTNTFRITISSPNRQIHKEYTLIINAEYPIFNVSLSGNHVTFVDNSIEIEYGDSNTVTVEPVTGYYLSGASCTNGYTITGLTAGTSATTSQTVTINNNNNAGVSTCTFITTPIEYTISYDLNGGTLSTPNPTTYTIETPTFTLNNPTLEDYAFGGWVEGLTSEKQITVTITQGSTGNKTYSATYKDGAGIFDAEGNQVASWSDLEALGLDIGYNCGNIQSYSSCPQSLTYIVYHNFANNNYTTLIVPKTVDTIGKYQFSGFPYNGNGPKNVIINARVIGSSVFPNAKLESLVLNEGLETIEQSGLSSCCNTTGNTVTSITLPASLKYIGGYALQSNSKLTSVTFADPNGWTLTSGNTVVTPNLSDSSTNATYFKSTYRGYTWTKQ